MRLERIPIDKIDPAPYNPRQDLQPGDPDYQRLKRSIDSFGCVEPLVWNQRSGNLVGGHQRLKILRARGDTEVSVVDLPQEREKALNVALNRISGDWDQRKLAELLDELTHIPDFDVALTGFDPPDAEALIAEILHADEPHDETFDLEAELAADRPIITEPGELIELGRHRLLCGDATDPEQVRRVMNGERAVLFATRPPYLVNYDGTNHPGATKRAQRMKNKDWSASYGVTWDDAAANPNLYGRFIAAAVAEAIRLDAAWYCWHASRRQAMVESVWEQHGAFVHQQIIWMKDRPILNRSWFSWKHEPCFFGWLKRNKPPRRAEDHPSTVWEVPTVAPGRATEHPTSKPLALFEIPMLQHTRAGELCYEPFAGSGSQLIAAERLGRRCAAIEISPRYCDVIVRRYLHYMGDDHDSPALHELAKRYTPPEERGDDTAGAGVGAGAGDATSNPGAGDLPGAGVGT